MRPPRAPAWVGQWIIPMIPTPRFQRPGTPPHPCLTSPVALVLALRSLVTRAQCVFRGSGPHRQGGSEPHPLPGRPHLELCPHPDLRKHSQDSGHFYSPWGHPLLPEAPRRPHGASPSGLWPELRGAGLSGPRPPQGAECGVELIPVQTRAGELCHGLRLWDGARAGTQGHRPPVQLLFLIRGCGQAQATLTWGVLTQSQHQLCPAPRHPAQPQVQGARPLGTHGLPTPHGGT